MSLSEKAQVRWQGDFSLQRQRAQLHKIAELPLTLKPEYTEEYNYQRGGKIDIPYTTQEKCPFPRTDTTLPSSLEVEKDDGRKTSKLVDRLPMIPLKSVAKMQMRNRSQVQMLGTSNFSGKFTTTAVLELPETIQGRLFKKGDPSSVSNLKLNAEL